MRTILCLSACFISLLVAGCGDSGGGSGGNAGSGGSTGGSTASGGGGTGGGGGTTAMGGSGGTGGSTSAGGTGGVTSAGGTGGATMSGGAAFGEACAMDTDCADGLVCFNFNAKGMLCTKTCQSAADCPAPSSGCNGMGYCKPN